MSSTKAVASKRVRKKLNYARGETAAKKRKKSGRPSARWRRKVQEWIGGLCMSGQTPTGKKGSNKIIGLKLISRTSKRRTRGKKKT